MTARLGRARLSRENGDWPFQIRGLPVSDKRITDISFDAYWDTNKPNRWHLVTGDERFGKGFWFVVTSNPLSADYRPREFNRGLRAFQNLGVWLHPEAKEAPEYNRHIAERIGVIVQHLRDSARDAGLTENAHERAHSILDEAGVGDPDNDELGDRITMLIAERDRLQEALDN